MAPPSGAKRLGQPTARKRRGTASFGRPGRDGLEPRCQGFAVTRRYHDSVRLIHELHGVAHLTSRHERAAGKGRLVEGQRPVVVPTGHDEYPEVSHRFGDDVWLRKRMQDDAGDTGNQRLEVAVAVGVQFVLGRYSMKLFECVDKYVEAFAADQLPYEADPGQAVFG